MSDADGWGGRRIEPDPRAAFAEMLKRHEARITALETRMRPAGGGGGRTVATIVMPGATGTGTVDLGAVYADLLLVRYSGACRLRLGRTEAGLIGDAARPFTTSYLTSGRRALLYDYMPLAAGDHDLEAPRGLSTIDPEDPDSTLIWYRVDGGPVDIEMVVMVG